MRQKPPNQWKVVPFADIGTSEEFVRQFLELPDILNAGTVFEPEREQAKHALATVLIDGVMPAFLKLEEIRDSTDKNLPQLNRLQLYEDLARKLWKTYKDLMQRAAGAIGFDLGFLFQKDSQFEAGLRQFREANPSVGAGLEEYFTKTRNGWQKELAEFRNEFLEHQTGDRSKYQGFYNPQKAEALFSEVWHTTVDILSMLLSLRLPNFVSLIDHGSNDPNRAWPNRFQFQISDPKSK